MESGRESQEAGPTEGTGDREDASPQGEDYGPAGWGASARERVERGFDRGKEAFGAFKESLEETIADARERGDLTTDRARELWSRAVDRARDATSDARDRFDFAGRGEVEALERRVAALEVLLGVPAPEAQAGPVGGAEAGSAADADAAAEPAPEDPGEGTATDW